MKRIAVAVLTILGVMASNPASAQGTITITRTPNAQQLAAYKAAASADMRGVEVLVGLVDINSDGKPDLVFQLQGTDWCGSAGCSALVLLATPNGYSTKAIDLPNFQESMTVRPSKHGVMHDLSFDRSKTVFVWLTNHYEPR